MKKVNQMNTKVIHMESLNSFLFKVGVLRGGPDDSPRNVLTIKIHRVIKSIELVGKTATYLIQIDPKVEESSKEEVSKLTEFLKSQSVAMKVTYASNRIVGLNISTKFKFHDLFKFKGEFEPVSLTMAQLIDTVDYKYYQINSLKLLKLFKVALVSRTQVVRLTNLATGRFFVTHTCQSLFEALNRKGLVYNRLVSVPSVGFVDEFLGVDPTELLIEVLDPKVPVSYYKRSEDGVKSTLCVTSK